MHHRPVKKHEREFTKRYIGQIHPKKQYRRGIYLRKRRPFELFWSEILFAIVIILFLVMLAINYQSNLSYQGNSTGVQEEQREIEIGVNIQKSGLTGIEPAQIETALPVLDYF